MKILHLTDLHLTEGGQGLSSFWAGLKDLVGEVDAVVVSGDLTQDASSAKHNYQEVSRFLHDHVMPVLKVRERRRIVVVPGNHDVDWTAEIGTPRPCDDPKESDYYRSYVQAPELSLRRYVPQGAPPSKTTAVDLDPKRYRSRFANFASFLASFYSGSEPDVRFRFDEEHADWSAHSFPEHRVIICGFNSCAANDRYWRGASLEARSIAHASEYISRTDAAGYLRIAVWHHGLTSPRGMPDHLTVPEIGLLVASKFQVGIHGHTHEDELTPLYEPLRRHFPVIATGSFAAGARERPGGVRNQASIITLRPTYLNWQLFQRDNKAQWERGAFRVYDLQPDVSPPAIAGHNECTRMTRSIVVDENGIAKSEIVYENLSVDGELVLAAPEGAIRNVSEAGYAQETKGGKVAARLPVTWSEAGTGRVRARIELKSPEVFERLTWSYEMGDKFSLNAHDAGLRTKQHQHDVPLDPGEDAWSHVVRLHTTELILSIEWRIPRIISARVQVQKRVQGPDKAGTWENDLHATRASGATVELTHNCKIVATIPDPRPNYRYCIVYKLEGGPAPLDPNEEWLLREMVRQARHERQVASALATELADALRQALCIHLECDPSALPVWMLHLWDPATRRLSPVCGDFPPRSLGAVFEYGVGMIGHAFRVGGPTLYARADRIVSPRSGLNLLYQLRREQELRGLEHEWVMSLPIVATPSASPSATEDAPPAPVSDSARAAPVGVLSFSAYRSEHETEVAARLHRAARLPKPSNGRHEEAALFDELSLVLSETLWAAIAERKGALGKSGAKIYLRWPIAAASVAPGPLMLAAAAEPAPETQASKVPEPPASED